MSVDINKSTFTAEEAAELMSKGYEMIECAECGRENYWVITHLPQPSWFTLESDIPVWDIGMEFRNGIYIEASGDSDNECGTVEVMEISHPAIDTITIVKNKEPSW